MEPVSAGDRFAGSSLFVLGFSAVFVAFLGLVPWWQRDVRVHRVPAVALWVVRLRGWVGSLSVAV